MGAGVPAVPGGGVVDDLAVGRGPGFAQQPRGLGQGQPLGDGGLEVDPVVVPQSLSLFHSFFVLSLRWGGGEGHDSQKPGKEEKEGQGGRVVAITQSSNSQEKRLIIPCPCFLPKVR